MYELTVEREFCAAHAIQIGDDLEPVHGHNWQVRAVVGGPTLDRDGLLCDFHVVEATLDEIVGRFHNTNLNDVAPFDELNPTAEHVARHIAEALADRVPAAATVRSVSVTEAPGCTATFWMSVT